MDESLGAHLWDVITSDDEVVGTSLLTIKVYVLLLQEFLDQKILVLKK